MSPSTCLSTAQASPLLRDLAQGFHQQMYFWGLDVAHRSGNLLVAAGFDRRPSPGLTGTSCYRLPWQHGVIELHGTYAGFQTRTGGAYYVRPLERCGRWRSPHPPVAGHWDREAFDTQASPTLIDEIRPLLEWWLDHERHINNELGTSWRQRGFKQFRKLSQSRRWLDPNTSTHWLQSLLRDPETTLRARRFTPHAS